MGPMPRRILYSEFGGKRPVGNHRRSCTDAVNGDFKESLGIRNWRNVTKNKQGCTGLNQEAVD